MALPAGRKGVLASELTPEGKIRGGGGYVLPAATSETLGGIKVGEHLSIDDNGVLSAVGGSLAGTYRKLGGLDTYTATANGFIFISGYSSGAGRMVIEDVTDTNSKYRVSCYVEGTADYCGLCMPMVTGHSYRCYVVGMPGTPSGLSVGTLV